MSVYNELSCYDQLKQHLESLVAPDQTLDLSRNGDFKDHIFQAKQEVEQKYIYQFKIIRTFILKENIRVDALKSEYELFYDSIEWNKLLQLAFLDFRENYNLIDSRLKDFLLSKSYK